MTTKSLVEYCKVKIQKHPQHKKEIISLYELCISKIENGESEDHEVDLCIRDIDELIKVEIEEQ